MPMPFFDNPEAEVQVLTLISRMIALHQAVENKVITPEELTSIGRLSTGDLQSKSEDLLSGGLDTSTSPNDSLKKLYDILKNVNKLAINHALPLIDGLKRFDSEHGEYLSLLPLAVDNQQTLSVNLNDFATFYNVFVRHMSYKKEAGELGDQYTLNFDILAARTDWLRWQHTRPARISFDPSKAGYPGLFEKFLAGKLKKDEWLTDLDIQRELTILGLQNETHIVPFKEDDIGLVLHFEREKHQHDDPKKPYVIPLIVNLGEDGHSRIDSRGVHWTRMLVTVDPVDPPARITVDYTDELFLHERGKKDIESTIRNALKYRTELGGYAKDETLKIYTAFPECEEPTINITGSGEQKDGYTCGYRALRGLLADLIDKEVIEEKESYRKFLDCPDSTALRNFVYRSLLGEQRISNDTKAGIEKIFPARVFEETSSKEHGEFVVKPMLVEGQLLAFSQPVAMKKEGKKGQFNSELLEKLVMQDKKMSALRELTAIKEIASTSDESLELNVQEILDKVAEQESDPALVLQVVFEQTGKNSALTELKLVGTGKIDEQLLHEKIDGLPRRIKLTSDEPGLQQYLAIINARNELLNSRNVKVSEGVDPWDSLFEHMLFTPSLRPSENRFEWMDQYTKEDAQAVSAMGVTGFIKLLQYMAAHEDRFVDSTFPFDEFNMTHRHDGIEPLPASDLGLLIALREHVQSEEPFTPFKRFQFTIPDLTAIDNKELVRELDSIMAAMPGLEKLEIKADSLAGLSEETVQTLIDTIKEKGYPTILSFSTSKETVNPNLLLKLRELENTGLANQRQKRTSPEVSGGLSPKSRIKEPAVLGKIGKAILQTEGLEGLDTEVQIQEQQQQQVQQQIQTALDDEELSEEDEIEEEAFAPYTGDEKLLTRESIGQNGHFITFIAARHPHLTPSECWDLITGSHADSFKYGIKKMTVSAAEMLLEHLQDVQYGLHPDNLPRGFSLKQDQDGNVVLAYTPFNPAINPNESPLTIQFSKPRAPNQWSGNALQFMSREQAQSLYDHVIKPMNKSQRPALKDCISQFFFLKSDTTFTESQRVFILNSFIEGMVGKEEASAIRKQIRDVFGDKLSSSNINALSEVFYEQGPQGLSDLLDTLNQIKTIKGEKFFASFKTCFIDPSQNLNELTTESAHAAMQKLLTLSSAQTAWWVSLTEQHTSNLYYQPDSDSEFAMVQAPGQRWANLAELTDGFLYFCGQLEEVSPGLNLTEYCPLTDVADMRVALDRLLTTILPNAHDVDEQFYEGLGGLSLDPLGPFYASRYEGYKLVTPDMMLDLGDSYSQDPKINQRYSQKGFSFRCDKGNIGANLAEPSTETEEKRKSLLMRYIATFNYRAPQSQYLNAFNKISRVKYTDYDPIRQDNLLILIAAFGTGKRGKHFTQEDIDRLIEWTNQFDESPESKDYRSVGKVLAAWRGMRTSPIRPTIAEITEISGLALDSKEPTEFITNVQYLVSRYGDDAEGYIEALLALARNKQNMGADHFQKILFQIEGLNGQFRKIEEAEAEFELDPRIGRDLHLMYELPDSPEEYENSYIFIKKDETQKLYYVKPDGKCEAVGIDDFNLFEEQIGNIEHTDKTKLHLSEEQIKKIITLNGGHAPRSSPRIRVATAKLLAVCNSEGVDESNALEKARALYAEVGNCLDRHGAQTTSDLLELLGHIDVEKSKDLPSLDALIDLVKSVAANDKPDYSGLERAVKSALPETCVIQMEKVTATPVEPAGNLHTIITKFMGEIMNELAPNKSLIDDRLGEGFFDSLATPEGTRMLLGGLEEIATFSGIIGGVVKGKVQSVMLKVYDSVTKDGLERIGIRDELARGRLAKIINHKVHHPITKEPNFDQFARLYAGELNSLSQFLTNLQRINKTWPADFRNVLDVLDNSPRLKSYPLPLLADISGVLVDNFNKNAPFPTDLLQQFLAFEDVTVDTIAALKGIVDVVFDKERVDVFNDSEKKLLCELALRYCHDNAETPRAAPDYIAKLLPLRELDGALFTARLKLLSGCERVDDNTLRNMDDAFQIIIQLNNPALTATTFDFFTEDRNRASDFIAVMTTLGQIEDAPKQSLVLAVALKAAQGMPYQGELFRDVIDKLNKLEPKELLQQLDALYRSPRSPDLSILHELLSAEDRLDMEALQTLQAHYDRDYWLVKKNQDRDFGTDHLAKYLDNLQDLNYERPLLLSQREELQRWFLYVNTIGNNRGVPTRPWTEDGGSCKPFKEMSHGEIQGLLKYYRDQLKDTKLSPEQRLKVRLETIALLREAMYRGTGKFPRPTQILYLLTAMQSGQDFIAQIQTGQGKSLTSGLAAAMINMEGKTVDVCTSNLFLAEEGLNENRGFFEYLGMSARLIHATSGREEYEEGTIHYSSMSELALHRSKMQLQGKVFPEDCALIADEVDFSTLDDSTRYRYAAALDPVTDPYKSPYTWIYEALVQFADTQKAPKSDEAFLEQARIWLRNSAKSKEEKAQLKELESQPDVYKKRLETWLVAAGKTSQLIELEQVRFRVVSLEHKKYGQVSKACILTGGRPNIQAEFSDAIQQFLHVRLRQKYRSDIDRGTMPDFLVEPEKTYITTLNSKILFNIYKLRMGMSGTAGSREEIKEQYAKYGFRFVDIPPFTESKRQDLKPILTNPKTVDDPEAESRDHINRIVKETLHYLRQQKGGNAGPILIHCADKEQGEKIYQALQDAINKNPGKYNSRFQGVDNGIQRFYSSEKPTPKARNQEEQEIKEKAGQNGMITISTVFGRGTDIKPGHNNGLYTIDTYVDTDPYSSEDLERSKRQKIGRAGRAGQVGFTRLIVRRSEFSDIYSPRQMRKIPDTVDGLDRAISELNRVRNEKRVVERESRESFDDVKDIVYQEFFKYIQVINASDEQVPKRVIRDKLTKQWNLVLSRIDNRWEELQHDPELQGNMARQLREIATFACEQWNEFAKDDGVLRTDLTGWADYNKLTVSMPEIKSLDPQDVIETIQARKPLLEQFYVKRIQQYGKVDPTVSEAAVYSDFMDSPDYQFGIMKDAVKHAGAEATNGYIARQVEWLSTQAHHQKLRGKFTIDRNASDAEQVEQIMGALLYLRYKAYRDGNPVGYARLSQECRRFEKQMLWSGDELLIDAVVRAQQSHFNALTNHRGEHEVQKGTYLNVIMSEGRQLLPEQTSQWKKGHFAAWWSGDSTQQQGSSGIKAQAQAWLTTYKDKWWTRGWVSGDRKQVVATLLENLQKKDQSPEAILRYIAEARRQLLEEDTRHSRSLKSGVQGRLYQYLNELELKVQAAMAPDELDANTDNALDNVKVVLQQTGSWGIGSKEVSDFLDNKNAMPQEKYQALSVFFNNALLMAKPNGVHDDNWEAFQDYCQQTKLQMVRYFAQCDKNSSFNEQRSIQVYQAASQAAAAHVQRVMSRDVKPRLNLPANNTFTYRDKNITFATMEPALLNEGIKSPLFLKVNQAATYRELLHSLEKAIVENSPNDTQVQFTAVTLDTSKHYPHREGFKLVVDMIIDGVPAQIDYHINMKTGEMYCNDQKLQQLNEPYAKEPELGEFTLDKEVDELERAWKDLKSSSRDLTTETQEKILLIEKRLEKIKQRYPEIAERSPTFQKYKKEVNGLRSEGEETAPDPKLK
ncbi:hypothetical protein [Legionella spiritensis]|uniref:hypothetical protein n=1 Tax=Legionella spiritensis TaxID=452 RepID=UPI000F6EC73F|nr:hypothetical protein [Legionella spiritensis]VEG92041.1 coiled-coil protein [Legionella spiritensis]